MSFSLCMCKLFTHWTSCNKMKKYLFWEVYINHSQTKSTANCDPDSGNSSVAQLYYCKQHFWSPYGSCGLQGKHKGLWWNVRVLKAEQVHQENGAPGGQREGISLWFWFIDRTFLRGKNQTEPNWLWSEETLGPPLGKCANATISLYYDFFSVYSFTNLHHLHSFQVLNLAFEPRMRDWTSRACKFDRTEGTSLEKSC